MAKYEASRNLGEELLAAAREIKAGKAARVHNIKVPEILEARMAHGAVTAEICGRAGRLYPHAAGMGAGAS